MKTSTAALLVILSIAIADGSHTIRAEELPGFGELLSVEMVLVDAYVEDRQGRPVTDLGPEDFKVYEDGHEVEILQLTQPEPLAAGASQATGDAANAERPARFIIFIDQLHLGGGSRLRVFDQLAKELEGHLGDSDEVMVVSYGGRADVVLPMTRDRRALRRVLREQTSVGVLGVSNAYREEQVLHTLESFHNLTDPSCTDHQQITRAYSMEVHQRTLRTISELRRFVDSLGGYSGNKTLLHVSDGIPLIAGLAVHRFLFELCSGTGAAKGLEGAVDASTFGESRWSRFDPTKFWSELQDFNSASDWSELAGHANKYQVSFYAYQASGLAPHRSSGVDRARVSVENAAEAAQNKQDALAQLADETGGVAIFNSGTVGQALTRMTTDARSSYELAYESRTPGDGRQHKIKVEVVRPGLKVRHRKSYRSKRPDERAADQVMSALVHGIQANPLDIRVDVDVAKAGEVAQVGVRIPLKGLVLLPKGDVDRGAFDIFVATSGEQGRITEVGRKTIPLSFPPAEPQEEFHYVVEVPLLGGRSEVAVGVRDQIGGDISYVRRRVSGT